MGVLYGSAGGGLTTAAVGSHSNIVHTRNEEMTGIPRDFAVLGWTGGGGNRFRPSRPPPVMITVDVFTCPLVRTCQYLVTIAMTPERKRPKRKSNGVAPSGNNTPNPIVKREKRSRETSGSSSASVIVVSGGAAAEPDDESAYMFIG